MSLENNLREGEKNLPNGQLRDPERYFLTIFGQPETAGTWGWSFEGHHLSLNFVVRDGEVISETPSFWGCQPGHVAHLRAGCAKQGTRTLGSEEQLAFDLLGELTDAQRTRLATIAAKRRLSTAPPAVRRSRRTRPPRACRSPR